MKKILLLLCVLPLFAIAQLHPMKKLIMQEYWIGAVGSDNILYTWGINWDNTTAHPLPGGRTIKDAGALFNAFTVVANDGTFWYSAFYNTAGLASWTQVPTDTNGTAINNAIACWGFESTYWFLKSDSSLWQGGNDYFQVLGTSGNTLRPVQISPSGVKIKSIRMANSSSAKNPIMAVSSDSLTVYLWAAGSGNAPTTQTTTIGTHKIIDALTDGGNQFGYVNYYLVQMTPNSAYGHPVVMGNNCILMAVAIILRRMTCILIFLLLRSLKK
jgi:alpha-tubulin suppressor-like RCC1 family protein